MAFSFHGPRRTFETDHPFDAELSLRLYPASVATVSRLDAAESFDDYAAVAADILSGNTDNERFTAEDIVHGLDYDQLRSFVQSYRKWLTETRKNDPN